MPTATLDRFLDLESQTRENAADAASAQRVADALTRRRAKSAGSLDLHAPETPEKPAEAPAPEPEPEPALTATSLQGLIDKRNAALETALAPWRKKYEAATAEAEQTRAEQVTPALEGVKAAAGVPVPGAPAREPLPPTPSTKARPFLDDSGKQSLQTLVQTLGLLAQVWTGASAGAPRAALGALTGAMRGWAQGDEVRAERAWREYLGQVDKIKTENDEALKFHAEALAAAGANMEQAKARLVAATAAAGMHDRAAEVALKGVEIAGQQWDRETGLLTHVWDGSIKMQEVLESQKLRATIAASTAAFHEATLKQGARRLDLMEKEAGQTMTDAQLDDLARIYGPSMQMPSFGMGKSATRTRYLQRLTEISKEFGGPAGLAATKMALAGLRAELTRVTQIRGASEAFAKTTEKNLDNLLTLSNQIDRPTGRPMLDRWLLAGRKAWSGDKGVADFDFAMRSAVSEVTRVLSSASATGVLTNEQVNEIDRTLSTALNKEQIVAVVKRAKIDMANRLSSYNEQVDQINETIRATVGGTKGAEAPASREGAVSPSGKYIWRGGAWQAK